MFNKLITNFLFLILLFSCGKKSTDNGGTSPVLTEENIVFSINPDPGTSTQSVLGTTHTINVLISSKLPPTGVSISWKIIQESNQSLILEEKSISTTFSNTDIISSVLSPGILYNCSITVTSKSKPTNTATKSFKLARK